MRVVWVDEPVEVFGAGAFDGAPTIEQVRIEVDHLRLTDDGGGARSFGAVGLRRLWDMQRLNGGPWRIATDAGI